MSPTLFKSLMQGTVSWYNAIMGTSLEYTPRLNKLKVNGRVIICTEQLRQQLLSEAILTYNSLIPSGGEQ